MTGLLEESGYFCVLSGGFCSIFLVYQELERAVQTLKIPIKVLDFCPGQGNNPGNRLAACFSSFLDSLV